MRKLWIFAALLAAFAAISLLAVWNLNGFLRDNRGWIAERFSRALDRPVEFEEVGVSFRGGLSARVTGLTIGDDPAYSADPWLRVAEADVVVKVLPALFGRYEVRRVVLEAPRINVIRAPQGFNFDSLGQGAAPAPDASAGSTGGAVASGNSVPLLVSLLNIRDGRIRVVDRSVSPSREIEIDQLDVDASDLGSDKPLSLDVRATMLGAAKPNLRLSGSIGPLGDATANAPVDLEGEVGPLVVDRLKGAPLVGPWIPAALSSPDPITAKLALAGSLVNLHASLGIDASGAAVAYDGVLAKEKGTPLTFDVEATRRGDTVAFERLELRLAGARLRGRGEMGIGEALPVDLQIAGEKMPLDGWAGIFPAAGAVEAAGTMDLQIAAKGSFAGGAVPHLNGSIVIAGGSFARPDGSLRVDGVDTIVALKGDRIEIPTTRFQVNGSPVEATATVESLRDLATEFSVTAPQVALSALGAGGAAVGQPELVKDVAVQGKFRAAADGPHLDVDVRSAAGSVRDVGYESLAADAALRGEKVTLRRLSVSTFGGTVIGTGSVDMAEPQKPEFAFRGKVGGLDVAALIERFAPKGGVQMTGRLDADVDVRGRGAEWSVIKDAVSGGGSAEVKAGALQNVNVADEVFRGITGAEGLSGLVSPSLRKKYPRVFGDKDTRFDSIDTKVSLGGGVADVERLALAAHDYRLDGAGTIDLDNSLDLEMLFAASAQLSEDLIGGVKQLKVVAGDAGRIQIPVAIRGSIPSIRVRPDLAYLSERLAGALVGTGIERGLDAVLGKKQRAPGSAGEGAGGEKEPTQKLIEKGLMRLFGSGRKGD